MRPLSVLFFFVAAVAVPSSAAQAHYLWIVLANGGAHGSADIIFEESPSAGDGRYLDHFEKTRRVWFRTVSKNKLTSITAVDTKDKKKRWLRAELPDTSPRSIDCYAKFGVYAYGKTNVLLHYYAKYLDVALHEDMHELGQAEQMDLDIVPHDDADHMEVTVTWRGKPAAKRPVFVRGPKKFRANLMTDEKGVVRFAADRVGRYTIRTNVEEAIAGEDGGMKYDLIRHHATLVLALPLKG